MSATRVSLRMSLISLCACEGVSLRVSLCSSLCAPQCMSVWLLPNVVSLCDSSLASPPVEDDEQEEEEVDGGSRLSDVNDDDNDKNDEDDCLCDNVDEDDDEDFGLDRDEFNDGVEAGVEMGRVGPQR